MNPVNNIESLSEVVGFVVDKSDFRAIEYLILIESHYYRKIRLDFP